jgi:hypothetical protein
VVLPYRMADELITKFVEAPPTKTVEELTVTFAPIAIVVLFTDVCPVMKETESSVALTEELPTKKLEELITTFDPTATAVLFKVTIGGTIRASTSLSGARFAVGVPDGSLTTYTKSVSARDTASGRFCSSESATIMHCHLLT